MLFIFMFEKEKEYLELQYFVRAIMYTVLGQKLL